MSKFKASKIIVWAIMAFVVIGCVFPFYWILVSSLKGPTDIMSSPPSFGVQDPTLENYSKAISNNKLLLNAYNSVIVCVLTVVLTIVVVTPAGFAIGYQRLKGTKPLSVALLLTQFLPMVVIIIPLFTVCRQLRLLNTPWALVITYLAFNIPVGIVLVTNYFAAIPKSLGESAYVEGCSSFDVFTRITLPLVLPGLASISIYIFISVWQEFLVALSFISDNDQYTLPVGLTSYVGQYQTDWGGLMATSVIIGLPAVAIILFFQRFFIDNMAGAVKG